MRNVIVLILRGDSYYAHFRGQDSERIRGLFGTTVIMTPYNRDANKPVMVENIQRLNPGYAVEVFGGAL
jgi:hypothetical protein